MNPEREYVLSTETTCDMPREYYQSHGINLLGMTYMIADKEYDSAADDSLTPDEFFDKIRNGAMPKTSQVTVESAVNSFEKIVKEGKDIFHLAFSVRTFWNLPELLHCCGRHYGKIPRFKVIVVDSLAASMGQGLMLDYCVRLKDKGFSLSELTETITRDRLKFCHNFTVNDLFHLHRGGRVSKMSAVVGTALGIKPLLHVDDDGHLINVGKTRGRKQALTWLVDRMADRIGDNKNEKIFISHSACYEDAKFVADLVRERFDIDDILIGDIGQVIGSHTGIGTVALFFVGDTRDI